MDYRIPADRPERRRGMRWRREPPACLTDGNGIGVAHAVVITEPVSVAVTDTRPDAGRPIPRSRRSLHHHHGANLVARAEGSFANGIELWLVGTPMVGFAPNVNVLSQSSFGLDLAEYNTASLRSAPKLIPGFKLESDKIVETDHGQMLRLEYLGKTVSGTKLHFLAYAAIADGTADVATFTAAGSSYSSLVKSVEPSLRTLTPITSLPSGAAP
ncbi:MAG TPA: hypothetical protein VFW20_06295 [Candidatus Limnocylindrales bacterium]|nr:hypothetical protein [Candidatus Limnocylindrales bacterium]